MLIHVNVFEKNTGFPCLILNTDQHRQITQFFSIKYGSSYIDLNKLEKNLNRVFGVSCSERWICIAAKSFS